MTNSCSDGSTPSVSKADIRNRMRRLRQQIDPRQRARMNQSIGQVVIDYVEAQAVRTLAAYSAFDGEPDLGDALARLSDGGIRIVMPVIDANPASRKMTFHQWTPGSRANDNRLGIREPEFGQPVDLDEIDLMLIPLVAWDDAGHRLGVGGGYFDRSLAPFAQANRPFRMGIGYQLQRCDAVPADDWDIPLHGIITDAGRFTFEP